MSQVDTSKEDPEDDVDNEVLTQEVERMAIMQTVRELKLKKEDNRMRAIETQIKMKRLQVSVFNVVERQTSYSKFLTTTNRNRMGPRSRSSTPPWEWSRRGGS